MNQLKDICRYIKLVERLKASLETEDGKLHDFKDLDSLMDGFYPSISQVQKEFMSTYTCGRSRSVAAYQDALAGDFIKTLPGSSKFKTPKYVEVTTLGRKLNSTSFKAPTGRYNIWLQEHTDLAKYAGGLVSGLLIAAAGVFIKQAVGQ